MLLSKRTSIKVSREYANLIGHMCYAASKLWNVCNYERQHYKETGMEQYPDWYYQKKAHKEDLWYKQLPSQTAQEVCKLLDKAWKSFYALKRSGGIETPRPPRFKQESIPITYMDATEKVFILHKAVQYKVFLFVLIYYIMCIKIVFQWRPFLLEVRQLL